MKKLPLLLAASILAGCGTQQSTSNASFDGEVFYRERIALPPSARLSVSLEDVSLADAPSVQLASQTREITSQVPLAFHLEYDPKQVKPGHSYAVSAHRAERPLAVHQHHPPLGETRRQRPAALSRVVESAR